MAKLWLSLIVMRRSELMGLRWGDIVLNSAGFAYKLHGLRLKAPKIWHGRRASAAVGIVGFELFTKSVLYYGHERAWEISWLANPTPGDAGYSCGQGD
jgi:hypothetical protein